MAFKKGSAAAKAFMAKLRASRGKKSVGAKAKVVKSKAKTSVGAKAKVVKSKPKKSTTAKKLSSMHKDTKSHNVNIRVVSGTSKTKKYSIGKINYTKLLTEFAKESKLKAAVVRSIKSAGSNYGGTDGISKYIADVLKNGARSGIVNELIYNKDTMDWYKKYNADIEAMLNDYRGGLWENSLSEIFVDWDKSDVFIKEAQNQSLIAWFSYEEVCMEIQNRLGF